MAERCVFCDMARAAELPHRVYEDDLTMACMDLRQFHPGHTLVMPRAHFHDVRDLDEATAAALMWTVTRVTRAVSAAFPSEGISLWHSIGPAAFQEVPHLHIHIHPRNPGDGVLRVYPSAPVKPDWATLQEHAGRVKACL